MNKDFYEDLPDIIKESDRKEVYKIMFLFDHMFNENKKYKEVINKIKYICDKVPNDWTLCGIDILHNIENILKEVEHE